ncbi:MAG TPA: PHP domain-containing protein, partial [Polyangia bacterium]|nr:PHP domain-containing protein [Polyangia bacterium]
MIRTGYSFKVAVGSLDDVLSRIKEVGWSTAPIADQSSTFGFVNFTKKSKDAGLRPVYGVRLNVSPDPDAKKPVHDPWTFLAVDDLRPLHDVVYAATARKSAALTYAEAIAAPGVIRIAGPRVLLDHAVGGDFYVGLSPALPVATYRAARRRGLDFVATSDNYYPREADRELYRIAIRFNSIQTYPTHILSDDEWRRSVAWFVDAVDQDAAIARRDEVLDRSRAVLKRATLFSPDRRATLRELCLAGAARLGVDVYSNVYSERLDRELRLIEEKQFADYFHILADIITWARERMVVGPARGSSCGSLVCYLLGITTVDPIPFDLVFERFIDTTRSDLPDVDVDFSDKHRHLVFEELERRYGRDRVARLGSVTTFQGKSALNVVAAALRVPSAMVDDVANVLIQRSQGDNRASATLEDTLAGTDAGKRMLRAFPEMAIAARLEDHPTNAGKHAAGVVLTAS